MCFFEQKRWKCGVWRWGNFRQQCPKAYRMGETCGLKLIFNTIQVSDNCKLCKDIEKKWRKVKKFENDINRWQKEEYRNASIEKAARDLRTTEEMMFQMVKIHVRKQHSVFEENTCRPARPSNLYY
ncbi:hypothetical protein HD806DRAFT_487635 [Xylariaceae sp. AK1471]|nr:hypothetical protein HD806DRAFT_487635 [Xylariaceae sp. AK1471]